MSTIIFDLDGTLLDTLTDLTNAVNYGLKQVGCAPRTIEQVRSYVGDGYILLMERACGGDKELAREGMKHFTEYYSKHLEDNTKPYRGILESIARLHERGKKMAIVSNKGDAAVQILCKKFFAPQISVYVGVTEKVPKKPAPDMLFAAMDALGSDRSDCVMVGDGETDIMMAKAAGIDIAAVTWGFRTEEYLREQGATRFIRDPIELGEL